RKSWTGRAPGEVVPRSCPVARRAAPAIRANSLAVGNEKTQNAGRSEHDDDEQNEPEYDRPYLSDPIKISQHIAQHFDRNRAENRADQGTRTTEEAVEHRGRRQA